MIIVNYLLCLSLVIISVVKTAEIFLKSDKSLQKMQKEFIQQTLKSHKGSISLVGANLVLVLSALLLFLVTKMQIEYREALYRKDSYLCIHYLNTKTLSYIHKMARYNNALRAAYIAITISPSSPIAHTALKTITLLRNGEHFVYLKNINQYPYCSQLEVLPYLAHLPFKVHSNLSLVTLIDETSIIKEKKWSLTTMKRPSKIRFKKAFCLKSTFTLDGEFFPNPKLETQELGFEDSAKLKCLSG